MLNINYKLIVILLTGLIFAGEATSKIKRTGDKSANQTTEKSAANSLSGPAKSILSINNITSWVGRDGHFPWDYPGGWNGSFPKGTVGVVFAEGIVWGAKVKNDGDAISPRVNGSTYVNGLSAGKVRGWSIDPDGSNYVAPTGIDLHEDQQVWRVRTDYLTADLTDDAANFFQIPLADVTTNDISVIFDQYQLDWNNWPAADGAPYEDVDGNGVYDPSIDVPGFPGASQTIWLVANDLDPNISIISYGSPPIGLEMQMTLWAYDIASTSPIGNTIFKRTRLIYTGKFGGLSTAHIDTMYISQWSDPDLGFFTDDYVGWDGDLQMGYVYNSSSTDALYAEFGLTPPAAGYTLLKGPVAGAETLTSSSFTFFGAGSAISDPDLGIYEGALQWFNLMEGFLPRPSFPVQEPLINPLTGVESKFWLDGDPVTETGWFDGIILPPGDRRMIQTTGPFEMALGDTQDIIIALIAGIGASRLESIDEIRKGARIAHSFYQNGFPPIPVHDLAVLQPNSSQADLTITLDIEINADEVIAEVYNYNDVLEGSLSLFDDGNNSDGAANDGRWGIQWLTDQRPYGMYMNALIISGTDTTEWVHLVDYITTLGPVSSDDMIIVNDNINNDGVINSGEKFNFGPVISNGSNLGIGSSTVATFLFDDYVILSILRSLSEATTTDTLPPGISTVPDNPGQYYVMSEDTPDGHLLNFRSLIIDQLHNRWVTEFQVTVSTLPFNIEIGIAEHVAGSAQGLAGYRVADVSALTGHQYEITFSEVDLEVVFNLENLTTASNLLELQTMPEDIYSTDIPTTEGFKVVLVDLSLDAPTTFLNTEFIVDADDTDGDLVFWGDATLFGAATGFWYEFGSGTPVPTVEQAQPDLQFRFTGTAPDNDSPVTAGGSFSTQWERGAFGELDLSGFNSVQLRIPFELWDIENNRQIEVAVINRNADDLSPYGNDVGTASTARWRMTGRDYIIVLNKDYVDDQNAVRSLTDPSATWLLFFEQEGASVWSTGDVFTIVYANALEPGVDVYQFQSVPTSVGGETVIPDKFALSQNYPNPFNPVTAIKYQLPFTSDVKLLIYNLLGQEVFRLERFSQQAGEHLVRWNGRNMQGSELSSGIYFYRLQAGEFIQTRKMVLLK